MLNRLAEESGPTVTYDGVVQHAFPRPADVLLLRPDSLRALGFSFAKARSLLELAEIASAGHLEPRVLEELRDEEVLPLLLSLRGIGRWNEECALLRGLGRINVFPGDDVGARNRLAQWHGYAQPMDFEAVREAVWCWHPFCGLVYFHLLLKGLDESGALSKDLNNGVPSA